MRKLLFFTLFLASIGACSGKSKRTAYTQDPGTGGSLGAAGDDATDSGGSSGRSVSTGGTSDAGGRVGEGARAGSEGEGATGATMSTGARAGSEGEGATGATNAAGTSSSGGDAGSAGTSPVTTCNGMFGFLGTWDGDVLDFYFDPIESVRLEFVMDDRGEIHGHVKWGEGAPPPPPVDGNTPYPPGYWDDAFGMRDLSSEPWPGFAYTVLRGAGCDATLRFGVTTTELFDEWCGMMEPVYTDEFGWGCILQGGGSVTPDECIAQGQNGERASYPPWKCAACGMLGSKTCDCDADGCFSSREPDLTFDLTLATSDGKQVLTGKDPTCPDCTLRLTRQE